MAIFYSENVGGVYCCVPNEVNWDLIRRMTVSPRFFTPEDGLICSTHAGVSFAIPARTFAFGVQGMRKYIHKRFPNAKVIFDFSQLEEGVEITPNRGRVGGAIISMLEAVRP